MGYIYKITNTVNGKIYVGKTERTIEIRFDGHIKAARSGNKQSFLHNAMAKYGIDKFIVEELDYDDNPEILNKKEIYWIDQLHARDRQIGYNQATGGSGGDVFHTLTPEQQQAKRNKHAQNTASRKWINNGFINRYINKNEDIPEGFVYGKLPPSDETRQKMSKAHKGNKLNLSDEQRERRSEINKGRKLSPETKEKLRQANLGKKYSDEVNQKKGRPYFGELNPAYGTHYKWLNDGVRDIRVYEKDYEKLPELYNAGYKDGRCNKQLFINNNNGHTNE